MQNKSFCCILLHFIAYFQGFERHMNNAYIYIYTQFMMPGSVSFDDIRNLICSHLHQNIELKYCNPRSKFMISCIELDSFFVSVHESMRIDHLTSHHSPCLRTDLVYLRLQSSSYTPFELRCTMVGKLT